VNPLIRIKGATLSTKNCKNNFLLSKPKSIEKERFLKISLFLNSSSSLSEKRRKIIRKFFFSGRIQDPDLHQKEMDPKHCIFNLLILL